MGQVLPFPAQDEPQDVDTCVWCNGAGVIEERKPPIYGPIVGVVVCLACEGTGRA